MKFAEWYNSRLNSTPFQKSRPIPKFPRFGIGEPKAPQTIQTPQRYKIYERQAGEPWQTTVYGPASGATVGTDAYIRGGLEPKRIDAITAHEQMHQMFGAVQKAHGAQARLGLVHFLVRHAHPIAVQAITNWLRDSGYNPRSALFNEEVLNYFHTYLTDPVNRQRIQKLIPSQWHQRVVDKHIKNSWRKILRAAASVSAADLQLPAFQKSLDDAGWQRMIHNHTPDYSKTVDHQFHTVNGQMPAVYQKLLDHPEKVPSRSITEGYFPKMIHDISPFRQPGGPGTEVKSNYMMMKPYHQTVPRCVESYANKPIFGWAAMANKALYNAGGIGHLAENVTATVHNDVPLTIHSFDSPDFRSIGDTLWEDHCRWEDRSEQNQSRPPQYRSKPNPLHTQQIALMDYLSNNLDRHNSNLLIHTKPGPDGYHPMLAIDHALSFQYQKTAPAMRGKIMSPEDELTDSPKEYLNRSALQFAHFASPVDRDWSQLSSWWKQHGNNIKAELNNQLAGIVDKPIREHIRKNFEQRWNVVNDWAQDGHPFNHQEMSIFNDFFPNKHELIPKEESDIEARHELRSKLPGNPYDAAQMLAEEGHKYPEHAGIMSDLARDLMRQMNPEQFSNFLINHYKHSVLNVKALAHDVLFSGNRIDTAKTQHFADQLKKMPAEFQNEFAFWAEHLAQTPLMQTVNE